MKVITVQQSLRVAGPLERVDEGPISRPSWNGRTRCGGASRLTASRVAFSYELRKPATEVARYSNSSTPPPTGAMWWRRNLRHINCHCEATFVAYVRLDSGVATQAAPKARFLWVTHPASMRRCVDDEGDVPGVGWYAM